MHPYSSELVDRTGELRIATTDPADSTVYLAYNIPKDIFHHVIIHELGHCVMLSYHLIPYIRRVVHPEYWIEAEEWVCNLIADHGVQVENIYQRIFG